MTKKEKLQVHAEISYVKSALRMIGYTVLVFKMFVVAAVYLFTAEILGIFEEAIL